MRGCSGHDVSRAKRLLVVIGFWSVLRASIILGVPVALATETQAGSPSLPSQAELQAERQRLLEELRAELAQVRSGPESESLNVRRANLASLIGFGRDQISSALGAPDYCKAPSVDSCSRSAHWAYFSIIFGQPMERPMEGSIFRSISTDGRWNFNSQKLGLSILPPGCGKNSFGCAHQSALRSDRSVDAVIWPAGRRPFTKVGSGSRGEAGNNQ